VKGPGCYGLILGGLAGLLGAILLVLLLRPVPPPPRIQPPEIPPDVTVFLSEETLSRMASETLQRPTVVDFEPNGRMKIITPVEISGLKPLITVGLVVEMQGTAVVSQLDWARVGFLAVPAQWLPQSLAEASSGVGQIIRDQTPPDFVLVGLTTDSDGIIFRLKWTGQ
jgi:hypothetical protein